MTQMSAKRRNTRRILTVLGARPQFIKSFPLSRALRQNEFEEIVVHTGQHFDWNMSDVFFAELGLARPKYQLDIHGGSHGAMTGRMLAAIEEVLLAESPSAVIVYGDTNSTLAGALAAVKLDVPVLHIEAGLRSFNRKMPEETNRVLVDHISSLLFCPTRRAVINLQNEGLTQGVHNVGDLLYDAVCAITPLAAQTSKILDRLEIEPRTYSVATLHRAENVDDHTRLRKIIAFLALEARKRPMIFPLHPRTTRSLREAAIELAPTAIHLVEPLGYLDTTQLLRSAEIVYTDSGGLQREAYFHRVPCVTLRDETEWVETLECGWNRLWTAEYSEARREIDDYGNGQAAPAIAAIMDRLL
jgi:UDP-GlcNAc3NAcA epimerase